MLLAQHFAPLFVKVDTLTERSEGSLTGVSEANETKRKKKEGSFAPSFASFFRKKLRGSEAPTLHKVVKLLQIGLLAAKQRKNKPICSNLTTVSMKIKKIVRI